jgi:hypothetical protein
MITLLFAHSNGWVQIIVNAVGIATDAQLTDGGSGWSLD